MTIARLTHPTALLRRLLTLIALCATFAAAGLLLTASPASAATVVAGSTWLGGQGVNVCYPAGSACPGVAMAPGESTWQCVELAARLYEVKRWIPRDLYVPYAGLMNRSWAAGYGLEFHDNGSGYLPVPGDLIIINGNPGHVSVVADPIAAGSTGVNAVEENYSPTGRVTYALRGSTITRPGDSRMVLGVIHAPANTQPYGFQVVSETARDTASGASIDLTHAYLGQTGTLVITVRNAGTRTWAADGVPIRLAAGTSPATDHSSILATSAWISPNRAAQVTTPVAPGGNYTFSVPFRLGVGDVYPTTEHLGMVAEGLQWFPDAGLGVAVSLTQQVDRAVALQHHGTGGYTLAPDGTVTPFGGAPALPGTGQAVWPGRDIARGLALRADDLGGYVLDGYGGLRPFGNAPVLALSKYWSGWDIARGVVLRSDGLGGYVLDGYGGLAPFGNAPSLAISAYWSGWDIAHGLVLRSDNAGGYVLDGYGGLHPFGNAPSLAVSAYWSGWDIARGVALRGDDGGYTLDGYGGLHPFGNAAAVRSDAYWSGWDVAKATAVRWDGSGVVLDGAGATHAVTAA